jgi:transcriptional regulator with XRE-family HTH domain
MTKNLNSRAQLRKTLNLTQDDMVMLLNISRPQWAYYELGKRELPTAALERLAVIEALLTSPEMTNATDVQQTEIQQQQTNKMLNDALKVNERNQIKLERMITRMEEKNEASQKMLKLISLLANAEFKEPLHESVLPILKKQANDSLEINNSLDLLKFKIQLHNLKQEASFLTSLLLIE